MINAQKKSLMLGFSILMNVLLLIAIAFIVNHMGGIKYFIHKVNNRGLAGQYEHRKALFESMELPLNKIIFLGNSLTEQCEWAELFSNNDIYNRGISGDGTAGVLDRMQPILNAQPKKVFLMIGINDLLFISKEEILENYERILLNFNEKTTNTELFVQSILPVNNNVKRIGIKNTDIIDLNNGIKTLASKFGYEYVDLHSHFKDETNMLKSSFTQDGIHLNAKGYQAWKNAIIKKVEN